MIYDALIIGGGVSGMQCALVLGSALKKPYAEGRKVGIILHQRSSHLQNALFNNVLGLEAGTKGTAILELGINQIKMTKLFYSDRLGGTFLRHIRYFLGPMGFLLGDI